MDVTALAARFAAAGPNGLVTVPELWAHMVVLDREVSTDTIQRDIRTGRLPATTAGRIFLIRWTDACDYAGTRELYDTLKRNIAPLGER